MTQDVEEIEADLGYHGAREPIFLHFFGKQGAGAISVMGVTTCCHLRFFLQILMNVHIRL